MATVNLSAVTSFPYVALATLGAAGDMTLVLLPSLRVWLQVSWRPRLTDAKFIDFTDSAADGTPIGARPYATIDHDLWTYESFQPGTDRFMLASAAQGQEVEIVLSYPPASRSP